MTLLSVRGLQMRYGAVPVLHGIDLDVDEGEVVALLGPNGAGKTSTLRALMGLHPSEGEIRFAGSLLPAGGKGRVSAGLCLVPEGRQIFLRMTVRENILIGAHHRSDPDVQREYHDLLSLFPGLASYLGQRAVVLSGGQQQMLAIARAVMARPRLLMLDEPSMGLSPIVTAQVFEALQRLIDRQGMSVLLVEQNPNLALHLATRAYLIERGRMVLQGQAQDLQDTDIQRTYLGIGTAGTDGRALPEGSQTAPERRQR